jgi:hypothetical protein
MENVEKKTCTKCEQERDLSFFSKNKNNKDGLEYMCKICKTKYNKKYFEDNREQELERINSYGAEHKEEKSEYNINYYKENKEREIGRSIDYYKNNKEARLEYSKEYRKENKEEIAQKSKEKRENRTCDEKKKDAVKAKTYYDSHQQEKIEYSQNYYKDNKEDILEKASEYYEENKEERQKYGRDYYYNNKSAINKKKNETNKKKRKIDPTYKYMIYVSNFIRRMIKSQMGLKKKVSCKYNLPFTGEELLEHLVSKFNDSENLTPDGKAWMTLNNHGVYNPKSWNEKDPSTWTWQIDHIVPQSKLIFNSFEHPNFLKCWSLENLRPYSAKKNIEERDNR